MLAKHMADGLIKKRKRTSKDEGRNDNKTRFRKPLILKFPKDITSPKADNGNRL